MASGLAWGIRDARGVGTNCGIVGIERKREREKRGCRGRGWRGKRGKWGKTEQSTVRQHGEWG
jgi:hypothetical protein